MSKKKCLKLIIVMLLHLCGSAKSTFAQTTEYKVGVSYANSIMSVYDRFEFQMNGGERIVIDSGHKVAYFEQKFSSGQRYKITQLSGTRACSIYGTEAEGVVSNNDILINASCGTPTLALIKLNVIGIEPGETFSFADIYGRRFSYPFSVVANIGGFPVGDPLIFTQTGGPRKCIINIPAATVPNSPLTIQADCRKTAGTNPPTKTKLNGIFTAPPGSKITLQLNNNEKLTLIAGKDGDAFFSKNTFSFSTILQTGTNYTVSIISSPENCNCAIYAKGEGIIQANTNELRIGCDKQYELVSRSSDNKTVGTFYETTSPMIAGKDENEGRYSVFVSAAKIYPNATGHYNQIIWRDNNTGEIKLISHGLSVAEGNNSSAAPSISADGKTVVFESNANNLVENDNNGARDVFMWKLENEKIVLVSKTAAGASANGESTKPVVAGNGNTIAFCSYASDLTPVKKEDTNVFVFDVASGNLQLISKDYETGKGVGGFVPDISDDGNRIVFCSYSSKLAKNDNNNLWDIFLWQRSAREIKRISLTSTGGERNQGDESASRLVCPSISGNGQYVAYTTTASNVVANDTNGMQDVFVVNLFSNTVQRVSVSSDGKEGNGDSPKIQGEKIAISYDGNWTAFTSTATNLGADANNIYMHSLTGNTTIPITNVKGTYVAAPTISRGAAYILFGCGLPLDKKFSSSGIFTFYTGIANCKSCPQ